MPEGCAPTEQTMGSGMTVYYLVDSLDDVSPDASILQYLYIFSRKSQADCIRWRRESTNAVVVPA